MIVRPFFVHLRHGVGIGVVPDQLVAWCVEQLIDGMAVRLLLGCPRFRRTCIQRWREPLQRFPRGWYIDLLPKRMVITHRLTPISESETGIDLLRLAESVGGFVEL